MSYKYGKRNIKVYHLAKVQEKTTKWDYGSWDNSQQQEQQQQQQQIDNLDKPNKYLGKEKRSKYQYYRNNMVTYDHNNNNISWKSNKTYYYKDTSKWPHDKYEELNSSMQSHKSYIESNHHHYYNMNRRGEKFDIQDYSTREIKARIDDDNNIHENENVQEHDEEEEQEHEEQDTSNMKSSRHPSTVNSNDKDMLNIEDDKSSISNVSTAMSDRNKNYEEETLAINIKIENKTITKGRNLISDNNANTTTNTNNGNNASMNSNNTSINTNGNSNSNGNNNNNNPMEGLNLSFSCIPLIIQNAEKTYNVMLYDDCDYENMLDKLCKECNVKGPFLLYLKIFIIKKIKESYIFNMTTTNPTKLDILYNKLLDINFKLIIYNMNNEDIDEDILPYINTNNDNDTTIMKS